MSLRERVIELTARESITPYFASTDSPALLLFAYAVMRMTLEAAAQECERVDTIINTYNSPLNGISHPVAERTREQCAHAIRKLGGEG